MDTLLDFNEPKQQQQTFPVQEDSGWAAWGENPSQTVQPT